MKRPFLTIAMLLISAAFAIGAWMSVTRAIIDVRQFYGAIAISLGLTIVSALAAVVPEFGARLSRQGRATLKQMPPAERIPVRHSSLMRKVAVGVAGGTVMLFGVAMIVLPGPGWATVFVGLAILGTEFLWARRWLKRLKEKVRSVRDSIRGRREGEPG